jgi:hypothetical protein
LQKCALLFSEKKKGGEEKGNPVRHDYRTDSVDRQGSVEGSVREGFGAVDAGV